MTQWKLKSAVGIGLVGTLLVCQAIVGAQSPRGSEMQLRAAQYKADVQGDLSGAIEDYRRIAEGSDRVVAAKALLAMGLSYQKLGTGDARAVFTRIVRDFTDQKSVVAAARAKLMGGAVGAQDVTARQVIDGDLNIQSISTDGRLAVEWKSSTGGGANIVLRDVLSGRATTLVAGKADVPLPQISNDGRRVAYGLNETVAGSPGLQRSLCIIGTESGAMVEVLMAPQALLRWEPLGWSPDGKMVLARVERIGDSTTTPRLITSRELAWISVESRSVRTIKTLGTPSGQWLQDARVSPDGRFIAFSSLPRSGSADRYLYVMDANGQRETAVVTAAG